MINVIGRVVDEAGSAMPNVVVEAFGDWLLTTKHLAQDVTDSKGEFLLEVPEISPAEADGIPLPFNIRVIDLTTKRVLSEDRELNGVDKNQNVGDLRVNSAEAAGLLVTNGNGVAEFVSEGNAVKLLVDGVEAFGQVAEDFKNAKRTINITQLFFNLPPKFEQDAEKEKPDLIFKFNPDLKAVDPLLQGQPPPVPRTKTKDERPERLIINAARANAKVRLLLNEPSVAWPEGVLLAGVLGTLAVGLGTEAAIALFALAGIGLPIFPVAVALVMLGIHTVDMFLGDKTHVDDAQEYFLKAIAASLPIVPPATAAPFILVRGFRQNVPRDGVFHCKMTITDEERAVIIGSPFKQHYFDSLPHPIVDPQRGNSTSIAMHDLSVGVVGPAVKDLYDSFVLFWNEDLDGGKLENTVPRPPAQTSGVDPICKVQVVRTLNGTRFDKLKGKSEKGILEGYLRAFAAAKHYIYVENQYFTDAIITEALVSVLEKNKALELILVVPIKPDVPLYTLRQACKIAQIREAGGDQVGVFTRWAYDANHPKPLVAPVYIHAKGAVIDDSWATVGSANLDGLSLDYNLLLSPLAYGEMTATELNINILPTTEGAVTEFALQMRKRLFAEHLGLIDKTTGKLDPNHQDLRHDRTHKWLPLWRQEAKKALAHVQAGNKTALNGFVLEYPKEGGGCLDTPRKHLKALGINTDLRKGVIRPINAVRRFHFETGLWDKKVEREDFEGAL